MIDWRPHSIVTDPIMPWTNGYQAIRCLAHYSLRGLAAFVRVSALTEREVPSGHQYNENAITHVDKPFHIKRLLATITAVLGNLDAERIWRIRETRAS